MYRVLYVGDVHCTPEEIGDCQNLIDLILRTAESFRVDAIVFLGDIFHTHAIVRVEVLNFWKKTFHTLSSNLGKGRRLVSLVGNHDQAGNKQHALVALENEDVLIVDRPSRIPECDVLLLPYTSDKEEFLEWCRASKASTVVCHQTFDGSTYENGFFAKEALSQDLIPQSMIISGHIHKPQEFGKVLYVGSPRWRTLSDANTDRAIMIVDHNETGEVTYKTRIDTGKVCRQIRFLLDTPEAPVETPLDPKHDWRIDIEGPPDWIQKRKAVIAGPGVKVRSIPRAQNSHKVRESDGIDIAFHKFLESFKPKFGTPTEILLDMAKERIHV